ncbi:hypothetical protein C7S15_8111 [Burkholderia cepacia]|nr:hypothetical protein [Burkholderia cepacia]
MIDHRKDVSANQRPRIRKPGTSGEGRPRFMSPPAAKSNRRRSCSNVS